MKKTKLLICLMLVFVMLFGAVQAFAAEEAEETTGETIEETIEETTSEEAVDTAAPSVDNSTCPTTGGEHQFQEGWKTSATEHWHYCLKCKKKVGVVPHTFGEPDENYQMTCAECGKKVDAPHEHGFAEEWTKNAYKHWHACKNTYGLKGSSFCKDKADETDHSFGENGLCTVCGAEDVIPAERPGDAGINWTVIIVIGVVGVAAAAAVFLIKKKEQ